VDKVEIQYSPISVKLLPIAVFFAGIVGPVLLIGMCIQSFQRGKGIGALIFMLIPISLFLVLLPFFLNLVKSFISFRKNKPALSLTPDLFIDNYEDIRVSWNDISAVYIYRNNYDFLKVKVIDNSIVYRQARNKSWKFIFWNNAWGGRGIISINMIILKGKNSEILRTILEYQHNAINHKHR
jgi:hypothetical protein